MDQEIKGLIDDIKSQEPEKAQLAISQAALLLERHSRDAYKDPMYEEIHLLKKYLNHVLTGDEFDQILDTLIEIMTNESAHAPSAAWALGKAGSVIAVDALIKALKNFWQENDELAYQILVALDNFGLDRAEDLVNMIAQNGLSKSKEFAMQKVKQPK